MVNPLIAVDLLKFGIQQRYLYRYADFTYWQCWIQLQQRVLYTVKCEVAFTYFFKSPTGAARMEIHT
jgi:hypothetical protein